MYKCLTSTHYVYFEFDFTVHNAKDEVWYCRSDIILDIDGFPFSFLKRYQDIMQNDIMEFVEDFLFRGYAQ